MDSYGLRRPMVVNPNNSQNSFNVSNASFNTSLVDHQNYGQSNHMSSSSSSLLPNSDAAANYPAIAAYMRNADVAGVNFIASKMATNSQSSSPSLNYAAMQHHRPSYSPKPSSGGVGGVGGGVSGGGGYENRALTVDNSDRAHQLGLMTRKSMEDHLIKSQLNKVSVSEEEAVAAARLRQSTRSNSIILAQIQTSREIAKSCREMDTADKETFY